MVRIRFPPAVSPLRTVRGAGHRGWSRHSCTLPPSFAGFGEALVSEPGLADPPWASHPQPKVIEVEIDDGCCVEGQLLMTSPPTIVIPSGRRNSAPSPKPIASGTAPNIAAIVVMMIGRKRLRQA